MTLFFNQCNKKKESICSIFTFAIRLKVTFQQKKSHQISAKQIHGVTFLLLFNIIKNLYPDPIQGNISEDARYVF